MCSFQIISQVRHNFTSKDKLCSAKRRLSIPNGIIGNNAFLRSAEEGSLLIPDTVEAEAAMTILDSFRVNKPRVSILV